MELVPPSNDRFPWRERSWQLLCYYCNQPIYETKPEAAFKQRLIYPSGRWRHSDNDGLYCLVNFVRQKREIDPPRCPCCKTQTDKHLGFCSTGGVPPYRATPFSEKEEELERYNSI